MPDDDRLRTLVRSAAPTPDSRPSELDAVWGSIVERAENGAATTTPGGWWTAPRRIAVLATVAAVTLGAVAVPLALRGGGSLPPSTPAVSLKGAPYGSGPLTDTSLTPPGWSPVALGDAQISVPTSWLLEGADGEACSNHVGGWVFVGEPPTPLSCNAGQSLAPPANVVSIVRSPRRGGGVPTGSSGGQATLSKWAFDDEVTASGPLARKVLATLTRSPLSVVLARSDVAAPASWRTMSFAGLSFAVPSTWRAQHARDWLGCVPELAAHAVVLDTASISTLDASCPAPPVTAGGRAPVPGLVVASGKYVQAPGRTSRCMPVHDLQVCVEPASPASSVLSLLVRLHGSSAPVDLQLGLAGTGAVPRAILDSLRGADTKVLAEPACVPGQLTLRAGSYGVAGPQYSQAFTFTNSSGSTCVLSGWPSIALAGPPTGSKQPTGPQNVRVRQAPPSQPASSPVVLEPGNSASVAIFGADWNAVANTACPESSAASVTLPSGGAALTVPVKVPDCAVPYVAPFIPGTSDRLAWDAVVGGQP